MATNDIQKLEQYDLFCDGRLADSYPFFRRLRGEDPVHRSERLDSWLRHSHARWQPHTRKGRRGDGS